MRYGWVLAIICLAGCLSSGTPINAFFSDDQALQLLLSPDGERWVLLSRTPEGRILTAGRADTEWRFGSTKQQVLSYHWIRSDLGVMQVETTEGREVWVARFPANEAPSFRRERALAPGERLIGIDCEYFLTRKLEAGSVTVHAYQLGSTRAEHVATIAPVPDDVEACREFAMAQSFETDGGSSLWMVGGTTQRLRTFAPDDSFRVVRINPDKSAWIVTNAVDGFAGLQRISLPGCEVLEEIRSKSGDAFYCLFTEKSERPDYVEFVHPDAPPYWRDKAWPRRLKTFSGYRNWRPVSLVNGRGAFQAIDAEGHPWFLIVDHEKMLHKIRQYPSLAGPLGERFLVTVEQDKVTIPTVITLPPRWRNRRKPAPTIVFPHGGPFTQVNGDFDPRVHFLASRGYVVLQPNYRGSTGFGRHHQTAAVRNWGPEGIQQDLDRVVDWAVDAGYTNPNAVGVFGGSFGGYLALSTACFRPERYRCAAAFFAPSCMAALLQENPAGVSPSASQLKRYFGDPSQDDERKELVRWSPRYATPRIPLLLYHGGRDPLVPASHALEMTKQGSSTLLLDPTGGHGFADTKTEIAAYTALEQFFARYLKGEQPDETPQIETWKAEGKRALGHSP